MNQSRFGKLAALQHLHNTVAQTLTPSADMDLSITFVHPSPVCTLYGGSSLDMFARRPYSGSNRGRGTLDVAIEGTHVRGFTVIASLPTSLSSGSNSVPVSSSWAQSTPSQRFADVVGTTYRGTSGGLGTEFEHRFRFTSEATVLRSTPTGWYDGTITLEVTCSS